MRKVCPFQVRLNQDSPSKSRIVELCPNELPPGEVRTLEARPTQVHPTEVRRDCLQSQGVSVVVGGGVGIVVGVGQVASCK